MVNETVTDLITSINDAGGLSINMVAATEGNQFAIVTLLGIISMAFMFLVMWQGYIKPLVSEGIFVLQLRKVRNRTGRHILFIKHTSMDFLSASMIDTSTVLEFEKAIRKFKGKPFDLVLHTPGGIVFHAQVLAKAIQSYPSEVRAIVPLYAMSGGTLLSLACDKIHIGPYGCLGPVDPQLSTFIHSGSAKSWNKVIEMKGKDAKDETIRMAHLGEQVTKSIQDTIDGLMKHHISDDEQRAATVEFLTDGHIQHGQQLYPDTLQALGIPVYPIDADYHNIIMGMISSKLFEGVYRV